jgi:hypothetical protein
MIREGRYPKKKIGTGEKPLSLDKVQAHIDDFCKPYKAVLTVAAIQISPTQPPSKEDKSNYQIFRDCSGKRESRHHSYLKWFAYNHIKNNASQLMDFEIRFESRIFMPNPKLKGAFWSRYYGHILRRGEDMLVNTGYTTNNEPQDWEQEADVSCRGKGITVECGMTSPMSLAMPILCEAASKVLWLPHQSKKAQRNLEWADFNTPLLAYIISRPNER